MEKAKGFFRVTVPQGLSNQEALHQATEIYHHIIPTALRGRLITMDNPDFEWELNPNYS